jgi:hypothetical protein
MQRGVVCRLGGRGEVAAWNVTIDQLGAFGYDFTDAVRQRNTYKNNLPMYSPNLSNKVRVQYINEVKW